MRPRGEKQFGQRGGHADASCGLPCVAKHPLATSVAYLCLCLHTCSQMRTCSSWRDPIVSQVEAYSMWRLVSDAGHSTHLGKVGCVGSNLVRNDTSLDIVPVGQAKVLLGGDIAQKSGACRVREAHGGGGCTGKLVLERHAAAGCAFAAGADRLPEGKGAVSEAHIGWQTLPAQGSALPTRCCTPWGATAACSRQRPPHAAKFSQCRLRTCCHSAEAGCLSTAHDRAA